MSSHILWQNEEKTVTLLDIPRSIAEAQGFNRPAEHDLLSTHPRETPYPSCEPKSAKAKAKLVDNTTDQTLSAEYQQLLTEALRAVRLHCSGDWCLPRPFVEEAQAGGKKRKLGEGEVAARDPVSANDGEEYAKRIPDYFLSSIARAQPQDYKFQLDDAPESEAKGEQYVVADDSSQFVANDTDHEATLSISSPAEQNSPTYRFTLPPGSAFFLGNCADSMTFRKAIRQHARDRGTKSDFDFILLDPPWPNRSIKRTHKTAGTTYSTISSLDELGDLILDMQLESLMAEGALVGVWITNKQAARELVLGSGGLLECWDVGLIEEWIWLKTTTSGEPTSALDSLWKKPYEVLLLGRKRRKGAAATRDEVNPAVKRKVMIGVPDLHSRKPCLKKLIESLLPDADASTALEVFARHLVSGWTSWGDECIKYNWEGYWHHNHREEAR